MGFGSIKNHSVFKIVWLDLGMKMHREPVPYSLGVHYERYVRFCEIAGIEPEPYKKKKEGDGLFVVSNSP